MADVQILNELKEIKKDLKFIKSHMVDRDTVLDEDDKIAIREARKELKEGKTISHEDLKKELRL